MAEDGFAFNETSNTSSAVVVRICVCGKPQALGSDGPVRTCDVVTHSVETGQTPFRKSASSNIVGVGANVVIIGCNVDLDRRR